MKKLEGILVVTENEYNNLFKVVGGNNPFGLATINKDSGVIRWGTHYEPQIMSQLVVSSTTENRPKKVEKGFLLFDTTLGKPIFCSSNYVTSRFSVQLTDINILIQQTLTITEDLITHDIIIPIGATIEDIISLIREINFAYFYTILETSDRITFVGKDTSINANLSFSTITGLTILCSRSANMIETTWVKSDGSVADAPISGTFANKPDSSQIYIGYQYFCTDKQTTEGTTNGIMIYHKGENVWVDALGRVVS